MSSHDKNIAPQVSPKKAMERSLAKCLSIIVPVFIVVVPIAILLGFALIQFHSIKINDWASVKNDLSYAGSLVLMYLIGNLPKNAMIRDFFKD